jgi:hypothetical protein
MVSRALKPRPQQRQEPLGQLGGGDRVAGQEPLVEAAQLGFARIGTRPSTGEVRRRQAEVAGGGAEVAVGGHHDGPIIGDRQS